MSLPYRRRGVSASVGLVEQTNRFVRFLFVLWANKLFWDTLRSSNRIDFGSNLAKQAINLFPIHPIELAMINPSLMCLPNKFSNLSGSLLVLLALSAVGGATPAFVQGNYATPQTPQSTITVPFKSAQKAGDLNVVIVGWNDSTTLPTALWDSQGNTYQPAVGSKTEGVSQLIVYANNISDGPNAVTVTFNTGANYPDVRILEYSGISDSNPLDVAVGSTGNSASSGSVSLNTTNATDLLVGANIVWTGTIGPSSGWTQRMVTVPDGDIVEDRVVTGLGSYFTSTPLIGPGPWVMQVAAFRAAASGSGSGSAASPTPAGGSSVELSWNPDAPTSNSGSNPVGYRLHWGLTSGVYTEVQDAGNNPTATVSNLSGGTKYYFAVTAYNSAGVDSPPSNEVSYISP
jgi:Fibronectin type III domain